MPPCSGVAQRLLSECVQRANVLLVRARLIYPPDGHPQLDLGHGPEEGVDGVDDPFGLFVTVLGDTAQSGVQRDTSYSYSFKGWRNDSVKMENFFGN